MEQQHGVAQHAHTHTRTLDNCIHVSCEREEPGSGVQAALGYGAEPQSACTRAGGGRRSSPRYSASAMLPPANVMSSTIANANITMTSGMPVISATDVGTLSATSNKAIAAARKLFTEPSGLAEPVRGSSCDQPPLAAYHFIASKLRAPLYSRTSFPWMKKMVG